jgi:lipoprotein-releasing system permease protein
VIPLELSTALRYGKARPSKLVSSVSLLSIAGIALGVAALVVAMGLLSGYRTEIRDKLIGSNAEIVVFPLAGGAGGPPDTLALERRLAAVPRVVATARVVYQAGLASSAATPDGVDAVIKGVDAAAESRVSEMSRYVPDAERLLTRGGAAELPGAAIGAELARRLDVTEGSTITLSVPDASGERPRFVPLAGRFRVNRIFKTNFFEYDAEWVYCDREALRALTRMERDANVVEVKLDSIRDPEGAARAVEAAAGRGFSVADWRSMNGDLFAALAIQQTTLFLVIGLIVAVSTFNIVATLVMTVQEKKRDIAVLAVLGAEPRFFSRLFVWLGLLLGGTGVVAGVLFGAAICRAATALKLLSFPPGVAEIYFVSFLPFRVRAADLAAIVAFSAVAIFLASWVPARRAARVDLAEALRYE